MVKKKTLLESEMDGQSIKIYESVQKSPLPSRRLIVTWHPDGNGNYVPMWNVSRPAWRAGQDTHKAAADNAESVLLTRTKSELALPWEKPAPEVAKPASKKKATEPPTNAADSGQVTD